MAELSRPKPNLSVDNNRDDWKGKKKGVTGDGRKKFDKVDRNTSNKRDENENKKLEKNGDHEIGECFRKLEMLDLKSLDELAKTF